MGVPAPGVKPARPTWRQHCWRWGRGAAVCYLGVLLVLLLLENWLLYRPLRATDDWREAPPALRHEDVTMEAADGTRLHAWWCPTENWRPEQGALLYCHGNAGNLSHRGNLVAGLQELLGQAVLIFDYPGYGHSEGRPTEAGCYAAADAAYDWLTQTKQVPPESIVLYGKSLGGGVALDLAARRPHRAVVLIKTFTSIPQAAQELYFWLPAKWLVRNRFDNLAKIGQCSRPIFLTHGTTDGLIPFSHSQTLFAAAGEPKQLYVMEGHDHDDPLDGKMFLALKEFLSKHAPLPADATVGARN